MEYPKNFTAAEGCNSSESGWTMYISSPMMDMTTSQCNYDDEDEYNIEQQGTNVRFTCGEEHEHEHIRQAVPDNGADDTDDSMASDASSGPVNRITTANSKERKTAGYVTQKKGSIKTEKKGGGESSFKKRKKAKGKQ